MPAQSLHLPKTSVLIADVVLYVHRLSGKARLLDLARFSRDSRFDFDDLSLYVGSTDDANTLLDILSEFQEWSGLKISIKKSLATGALYGRGETQKEASAESRKRKTPGLPQFISKVVLKKLKMLKI